MKNSGLQKNKNWIVSIVLIGILITSCSTMDNIANKINGNSSIDSNISSQPATQASEVANTQNENTVDETEDENTSAVQPVVVSDGSLAAYQDALTQIYEGVNPSIVSIMATSSQGEGQGSGFVWDLEGHIITNNHVVKDSNKLTVEFNDGTLVNAEVIGTDVYSDLAVLKVDVSKDFLQPVQMANSDAIKVGQLAIAIGNPYGLSNTMTVGIVSAIGRSITAGEISILGSAYSIPDIIQTDAPINPGNSGGVLVDDEGKVIGVTAAIESSSGSNAGIGFAIPSNIVSMVVPSLIENGSYDHPFLGITGTDLTSSLSEAMNLDTELRGALVVQVTSNGPADKAGVHGSDSETTINGTQTSIGGDVITAIDGEKVQTMDDLIAYLYTETTVGQSVTLNLIRDGKEMTLDVTLEARPAQEATTSPVANNDENNSPFQFNFGFGAYLGVSGIDLTSQIAEAMNLNSDQTGVLIQEVAKGSPAEQYGLKGGTSEMKMDNQTILIGGDVITQFNNQPVVTFDDLSGYIDETNPGDRVTLSIIRDGKSQEMDVVLGFAE